MSDITKGTWEVLDAVKIYVHCSEGDEVICEIPLDYKTDFDKTHVELLAHATFIAEAGTVHNETGFTPRELLKQRDTLRTAAKTTLAVINRLYTDKKLSMPQNCHLQLGGELNKLEDAVKATKGR